MIPYRRRIVVTGLGVIAPNGLTLDTFWSTLLAGKITAAPVTRFDASAFHSKLACELKDFEATKWVEPAKAKRFDLSILYGIAAAKEAVKDAGLDVSRFDPERIGICEGTSVSGLENTLKAHRDFVARGYRSIQPTRLVNAFCGGTAGEMAIELGVRGPTSTKATACSSGNDAIADAARSIRNDLADVMIAGSSEAPITTDGGYYAIFSAAGVMSRRNDDPENAMRPFDRDRDGFVLGEGAAFMVLEELSHALARGARIYCEYLGAGQAGDAYHSVALHPEGRGLRRSIELAFLDAEIAPDQIDYVNAHASATAQNDGIETKAIRDAFGPHARRLAVSGTKPVTGHLMGGTAGLEAAICALVLHHEVMPPTANLKHPSPECDLDYLAGGPRHYPVRACLNLNAGFGGKNSALLLGRYEPR